MKYDLSRLDPRTFEHLCADMISKQEGKEVEIFSPGIDGGIDGRFWLGEGKKAIIQAKHSANKTYSSISSSLKKEVSKIQELIPERYILMTSARLTPVSTGKINNLFAPYIKREDDIWGEERIQNFLLDTENFDIVKKYNQLYIYSTDTLELVLGDVISKQLLIGPSGRSHFLLQDIRENAHRFVITEDFSKALKRLSDNHTIVITGEAGIGKTTLSNMLSFEYIKEGYLFYYISDIKEAEKILETNSKKKIIFYYDDFLGQNLARVVRKDESSEIMLFIKRVKSLKKIRFILNSRATIINEALEIYHIYLDKKLKKDEYLLEIQNLTAVSKAYILYKHLYFSDFSDLFIDEIYRDKRYKFIIDHKNFSPRIIEYILDSERADAVSENYFEYIQESLENPQDVWDDYFTKNSIHKQILVFLVTINQGSISETELRNAYNKYLEIAGIKFSAYSSFDVNMRITHNSLLRKEIFLLKDGESSSRYRLFNPSLGDYILNTYFNNQNNLLLNLLKSLNNIESLKYIVSMKRSKLLSKQNLLEIQEDLFNHVYDNEKIESKLEYLLFLIDIDLDIANIENMKVLDVIKTLINQDREDIQEFNYLGFYYISFMFDYFYGEINFTKYDFLRNFIMGELDRDDFDSLIKFILGEDIKDEEIISIFIEKYKSYIHSNIGDYEMDLSNGVDVGKDGVISIDESNIHDEISSIVMENFLNEDFHADFISKTSINPSEIVNDYNYDFEVDAFIESIEEDHKDIDPDLDTYKDRIVQRDLEIDEIFKR